MCQMSNVMPHGTCSPFPWIKILLHHLDVEKERNQGNYTIVGKQLTKYNHKNPSNNQTEHGLNRMDWRRVRCGPLSQPSGRLSHERRDEDPPSLSRAIRLAVLWAVGRPVQATYRTCCCAVDQIPRGIIEVLIRSSEHHGNRFPQWQPLIYHSASLPALHSC